MLLNCVVGEDSWESFGQQGDQTSQSQRKSILIFHWKEWCWSWSSNTLATWWEELTHWTRPWCWEGLKAIGEAGEDEMVGWRHWLNGHDFEQVPENSEGQGSLACCSPWGLKELDMTSLSLSWRPTRSSRTNTQKSYLFNYTGIQSKSRKSRYTSSNRRIWPWNTEWSRAKANRVLPKERTDHSKHPLPTTQETTLYVDVTRLSIPKSNSLYSGSQRWRSSI